jgi:hypothetical protein
MADKYCEQVTQELGAVLNQSVAVRLEAIDIGRRNLNVLRAPICIDGGTSM